MGWVFQVLAIPSLPTVLSTAWMAKGFSKLEQHKTTIHNTKCHRHRSTEWSEHRPTMIANQYSKSNNQSNNQLKLQRVVSMAVAKKFNFPKICDSWLRNGWVTPLWSRPAGHWDEQVSTFRYKRGWTSFNIFLIFSACKYCWGTGDLRQHSHGRSSLGINSWCVQRLRQQPACRL